MFQLECIDLSTSCKYCKNYQFTSRVYFSISVCLCAVVFDDRAQDTLQAGKEQLAATWFLCGLKELLLRAEWSGSTQVACKLHCTLHRVSPCPGAALPRHQSGAGALFLSGPAGGLAVAGEGGALGRLGRPLSPSPFLHHSSPSPAPPDNPNPAPSSRP